MDSSKVVRLALALVIAGVLIVPLVPSARAPPLVPFEAWGLAKTSAGASIGINQPIRTFIDGVDYSNLTSTFRADGSYQLQVAGNWYIGPTSETPALKEGGDPNDPIMFAHGDMTATGTVFQEIAPWVSAGFLNRDLTEGVAAAQPALIKIQTVTTRPADLLSQYAYICNPTAAPVDLSMYYFEKDVPGGFAGPQVRLTGIVGAGQKVFGDMLSTSYLNNNGDALKLVFDTTPGLGAPNAGADIVIGHHFKTPWTTPAPIRLYLNRGVTDGVPRFEDVTEAAGLKPLPMKAPHVEIQDFDNDEAADGAPSRRPEPERWRAMDGRVPARNHVQPCRRTGRGYGPLSEHLVLDGQRALFPEPHRGPVQSFEQRRPALL